jgi:putative transposase
MPRGARGISESRVYHVMLRGINRQNIFSDDEDRERFIETLIKYKCVSGYKIYGYCLMSNHLHLVIKEEEEEKVSQAIKRIGVSYVYWYNLKYERHGHLFQGRFKSENVEDDRYLLVVLRYIHQNPVKAGIVKEVANYRWSSYAEYVKQRAILTDIDFVLDIFDANRRRAVEMFEEFMAAENKDKCLDVELVKRKRLSDKNARELISKLTETGNVQILQQMNKNERDNIIRVLKEEGASIRQLVRISGLSRRKVEKA